MSFFTALTGLKGAQTDISTTSNNIANVGSTGFKKSRAEFGDIFSTTPLQTNLTGSGTQQKSITQQFSQGNIQQSTNTLDMAVSGQGFFALKAGGNTGQIVYTRNGSFSLNDDGYIIDTNAELYMEDLGPRSAGLVGFKWSDIPEEILDGNKRIKIEALIDTGSGPEQLSPSIYSKVISASVGSGESKQVLLNVEDYGDLDVSSAVNFR